MLEKEPQINTATDTPEDEIILSEVPDKGIFFDTLLGKALEKLKVKKSLIENRIMGLINKKRICWGKGTKLYKKPPLTTHPPSFFIKNGLKKIYCG